MTFFIFKVNFIQLYSTLDGYTVLCVECAVDFFCGGFFPQMFCNSSW